MGRIEGKVAVVTGGGSGIGKAIAHRFAAEGAIVYVAEIDSITAEVSAKESSGDIRVAQCDVTDALAVRRLAETIGIEQKRADILVNNAGTNFFVDPLTADEDMWSKCVDLDMRGAWLCVKALVPLMQLGGSIINIASTHPLRTLRNTFPYGAAKGGLLGMTTGWACDFGPRNIRVNAILPGFIVTPLAHKTESDMEDSCRRQIRAQCLKRVGLPGDVASLALFLASDESDWMTGDQIVLDGGRHVYNAGVLPLED